MINKLTERINKQYVIVSFVLLMLLGILMMLVVAPYFSAHASGEPYLETKFFYTPSDLLEMAEEYGESGRNLYIKISLTLDLLIPLLASNFLTAFSLYLTKKDEEMAKMRKPIFILGIATCASDWTENLLMISILKTYPNKHMLLAVMGRTMTSIKYLLMIVFVVIICIELFQNKHQK